MNIKKILMGIAIGLIVLVAGLMIFLKLSSGSSSPTTQAAGATDDGVLTVAVVVYHDAFCDISDTGAYSGLEPYLGETVARELELSVEFVEVTTPDEALALLNEGSVDLVMSHVASSSSYSGKYLSSVAYGSAGLYIGNPVGTYIDTLAVLSKEDVYFSNYIPDSARVNIPYIQDVERLSMPSQASVDNMIASAVSGNYSAYLVLTEGEAVAYAHDNVALQLVPMSNSPRIEYVALSNLEETRLMAYTNAVINRYLDNLANGVDEQVATEETEEPAAEE